MSKKQQGKKRLFSIRNDDSIIESKHNVITPYLVGSPVDLPMVNESSKPLNKLPKAIYGSKPYEGGFLILTDKEKIDFLKKEPDAEKWIKQYMDAKSFINNIKRWAFDLQEITPNELRKLPMVLDKVNSVREFRKNAQWEKTILAAETPTLFLTTVVPTTSFLMLPIVSSENRKYIPIAYLPPQIIPSSATFVIENASIELFGLLTSNMHMVWLRSIGGKLETRFRYSTRLVYNTFPTPDDYTSLEKHAQEILNIRANYKDATLADLYDPLAMPVDLKKAHDNLDKVVDKLYRKEPFRDNNERLVFLLQKYKEMINSNQTLI